MQSRASNHLGGYDITYNHYYFSGKILTARKEHTTTYQNKPGLIGGVQVEIGGMRGYDAATRWFLRQRANHNRHKSLYG